MEDRTFVDPLRERDLAALGVTASVHVTGGAAATAIVTLSIEDLDRLTGAATQRRAAQREAAA